MANYLVRPLRRTVGSLVLATGSLLLPVVTAAAAPISQATPVTMQATTVLSFPAEHLAVQDRRLDNGQFVRAGNRTGEGELTIDNNGGKDAVISLATNNRSALSVYVRNGSKYTVKGVRDGTYEVFFTTGSDWDSQRKSFTRDRTLQRFDKTLSFTTTRTTAATWTITIYPVVGGNANASEVNPNDFPAL